MMPAYAFHYVSHTEIRHLEYEPEPGDLWVDLQTEPGLVDITRCEGIPDMDMAREAAALAGVHDDWLL